MGIVKIDDELYEELCKVSLVMVCLINVQVEYWIKIGMLVEVNLVMIYFQIVNY